MAQTITRRPKQKWINSGDKISPGRAKSNEVARDLSPVQAQTNWLVILELWIRRKTSASHLAGPNVSTSILERRERNAE